MSSSSPSSSSSTTTTHLTATSAAAAVAVPVPLPTRMTLSAIAGMTAANFCHPLDVIRVQMQTEGASMYKNSYDAGKQIYHRAGLVNGLYAGISAAYLRQILYGSVRMGLYSFLLDKEKKKHNGSVAAIPFVNKLLMGCVSGSIGSIVGTPSELALVRMSADSKMPVEQRRGYKNVIDCVVRIAKEEGATKLWRGASPTVLRATLLASTQMGITSEMKPALINSGYFGENGEWMGGIPMLFCATLTSSFFANIVANPFDVVKSRMQNMAVSADGTVAYNNMAHCFVKSVRSEGIMVLYSGFVPAFIKLAPYTVISLTLADKLTKMVTGQDAF